jgi:hypothetical protein
MHQSCVMLADALREMLLRERHGAGLLHKLSVGASVHNPPPLVASIERPKGPDCMFGCRALASSARSACTVQGTHTMGIQGNPSDQD